VIEDHREWLNRLDVEIVADPAFGDVSAQRLETWVADASGIIVPAAAPITAKLMECAPHLRVISLAGSGYDSIDLAAATRQGIVVTHAPVREGAEVVADMAWGMMLAVARQIPYHDRRIRAGDIRRGMGTSPWQKKLGIVGLGNIGRAVARRSAGFEMDVLATEPLPDREFVAKHNINLVELDELLARCDFVSLHVRLTDQTRKMIGEDELATMRPTSFLINTARRDLVDEDSLVRALEAGRLAGAALDDPPGQPDSPLMGMDNVVLTTHLGNRARGGVNAVFRCAVQNTVDILIGGHSKYIVGSDVVRERTPGPLASHDCRSRA
jgi:D-3-phosphoglycerate dehydrogenase